MKRRRIIRALFLLSGLLPILALLSPQPDPTPLIYSLFVLTYIIRRRSAGGTEEARTSAWSFGLAIVGCGLLLESLSWANNFVKCAPQPALMHPQLLPDLALGIAFYGGWAIAWVLLLRRFWFSLPQLFCAQGAFGVLIEQRGAIFLGGLAMMPFGLVLWTYVFLVYGSVVGIAYLLFGERLCAETGAARWWRYPLAWLLITVLALAFVAVWQALLRAAGLLPDPRAICGFPLV
ncbi:MAG TPA: hypothetical protein VFU22_29635 [Roseiflexaceae bacterium]|nr:hypothetical protein [Roseiflexaceae bacterium]